MKHVRPNTGTSSQPTSEGKYTGGWTCKYQPVCSGSWQHRLRAAALGAGLQRPVSLSGRQQDSENVLRIVPQWFPQSKVCTTRETKPANASTGVPPTGCYWLMARAWIHRAVPLEARRQHLGLIYFRLWDGTQHIPPWVHAKKQSQAQPYFRCTLLPQNTHSSRFEGANPSTAVFLVMTHKIPHNSDTIFLIKPAAKWNYTFGARKKKIKEEK